MPAHYQHSVLTQIRSLQHLIYRDPLCLTSNSAEASKEHIKQCMSTLSNSFLWTIGFQPEGRDQQRSLEAFFEKSRVGILCTTKL